MTDQTTAQVAEKMGVSRHVVERIERGGMPEGAQLLTIQQWLFGEEPAHAMDQGQQRVESVEPQPSSETPAQPKRSHRKSAPADSPTGDGH
jgi:transcriptional regulator with XRE-family HTH domain